MAAARNELDAAAIRRAVFDKPPRSEIDIESRLWVDLATLRTRSVGYAAQRYTVRYGLQPTRRFVSSVEVYSDSPDNSGAVRAVRSAPAGLALLFEPNALLNKRVVTLAPAVGVSRLPH